MQQPHRTQVELLEHKVLYMMIVILSACVTWLLLSLPAQQVEQEKAMTESKWLEEKKRRIKTEKRLRLAEDSLKRLDKALRDSGVHIDIEIETDVKNLKSTLC